MMISPSLRQILLVAIGLICGSVCTAGRCAAQAAVESSESSEGISVEVGIGGAWKLGQICPIRVSLAPKLADRVSRIDVRSIDGDGVVATYQRQLSGEQASNPVWIPIRIGRGETTLAVSLLDGEALVQSVELSQEEAAGGLPSSHPLVVAIGDSMGIEQLSRQAADGGDSTFTTSVLSDASQLPDHWEAYSACDLIVLSASQQELLEELSDQQWAALNQWVERGGGCVVSLSGQADAFPGQLQRLVPGQIQGSGTISDPGVLESLVATAEQIPAFPATRLEMEHGRVELLLRDMFGRDTPWWIHYAHGHGTVQLVVSPLDGPALSGWQDRKLLWELLVAPYLGAGVLETAANDAVGDSSYLGYSDLVGQLRASLDVFPELRVFTFGQVAAVLIAVLLLIGPIDYFVSVRWLNRPQFSWYFAGISLLAISVGLIMLYRWSRPDEVRINSVQIVDIDSSSGELNGYLWSHVYSGSARRLDVAAETARDLAQQSPIRVDWQGLPGRGLGGLLSQLSADAGMPPYRIELSRSGGSQIKGVGVPAAGTKCLVGTWNGQVPLKAQSKLVEIAGVDQLTGQLVNPFDFDLIEPVLFYRSWYYVLNSRIPPGDSLTISYDTIPKHLTRRLNRKRTINGSDVVTQWDPADRDEIDRLCELMMFHKAASGQSYTSLSHRFQAQLDHSNLLETDQAILLARCDEPWASLSVTPQEGDSAVPVEQNLDRVWCRIIIPVETNQER